MTNLEDIFFTTLVKFFKDKSKNIYLSMSNFLYMILFACFIFFQKRFNGDCVWGYLQWSLPPTYYFILYQLSLKFRIFSDHCWFSEEEKRITNNINVSIFRNWERGKKVPLVKCDSLDLSSPKQKLQWEILFLTF